MRRFWLAAAGVATATAMLLTACGSGSGGSEASDDGSKAMTIVLGGDEIPYINPLNDNGTPGIRVAAALFAPLVRTNPDTGKTQNVIAESVKPNSDSTKWTIKIKSGLTFDDGEKLTAKDYVDSWNMTSQEARGWKNAAFFSRIKGWKAMNPLLKDGQKPPADLPKKLTGLKVVDDQTFTVELARAVLPVRLDAAVSGCGPDGGQGAQGSRGVQPQADRDGCVQAEGHRVEDRHRSGADQEPDLQGAVRTRGRRGHVPFHRQR